MRRNFLGLGCITKPDKLHRDRRRRKDLPDETGQPDTFLESDDIADGAWEPDILLESADTVDGQDQRLQLNEDELTKKRQSNEEMLMKTITGETTGNKVAYEDIEKLVTPRGLQNCETNTLILSMKVNYMLHQLEEINGADVGRFKRLANSVEEFTYRLLDPLQTDPEWCGEFGEFCLDDILYDAIEFEQKKFLTHPAVHSELNRKWHGRSLMDKCKGWELTILKFWCLFDLVFSPILLALFSQRKNSRVAEKYLAYVTSPYFKFFRDTLSYTILLLLHYAICLSPSTIAFSGLEWTILVFYMGRFLVELKQIWHIKVWFRLSRHERNKAHQSSSCKILSLYCSDLWNKFDFASLVVYFILLILRIVTWVNGGSATNNRALLIAGYLYSFNTLCLTIRAFGQVMEQPRDVGTIQIALFGILKDVRTVWWQFIAVILAFSMAITKIYMSERSFIANESARVEIACKEPGLSCWWTIFCDLGWSLLDRSEGSGLMISVDPTSTILAELLYAAFLVLGVVLLINMLIALLSNTYQKTEDNAIMEWSFKRAITIQTFDGYDPIPVPFNTIYRIFKLLRVCFLRLKGTPKQGKRIKRDKSTFRLKNSSLGKLVKQLEEKYFAKYTNSFPITDERKVECVWQETQRNRQMISQILSTIFASQIGDRQTLCSSQNMWKVDPEKPGIRIEGPLLTFECREGCKFRARHIHGARYSQRLSREFPYFEVTILEAGKIMWLGIGIVDEQYPTIKMPGWYEESVGYHTDDGNIFHNYPFEEGAKATKGPAMARRGDRIRCTVLFEEEPDEDGKIPVFFTLNGRKIVLQSGESRFLMDFKKPLFPFIGMTKGSSVLTKMCTRVSEQVSRQSLDIQESVMQKMQKTMEGIVSNEVKKATKCMEEKLDAFLVNLREKGN